MDYSVLDGLVPIHDRLDSDRKEFTDNHYGGKYRLGAMHSSVVKDIIT